VKRCPKNFLFTFEKCEPKVWKATIQLVLDILLAMGCFFSAILLIIYTLAGDWRLQRQGWRERERDAEQERPKQKDARHLALHNIRNVRVTFLTIVLLFTLAAAIVDAVFIVYLHEDRYRVAINDNLFPTAVVGGGANFARGDPLNVQPGWSARNTRLRWALSILVILTVLINLIPFTHRLLAYIFAFFYFSAAVMAFVSFAFDIHELKNADKFMGDYCRRNDLKCVKSAYIATAIMEFFLGLALLFYVFYEICFKCCPFAKSTHSKRAYALHEKKKHDRALDSLRPVRCEITGRVMTAKEYVYRWRFIAGTAQDVDYVPLYPRVPLYAAEGYVPEQYVGAAAGAIPVQALY
jgi:heme A synthase